MQCRPTSEINLNEVNGFIVRGPLCVDRILGLTLSPSAIFLITPVIDNIRNR